MSTRSNPASSWTRAVSASTSASKIGPRGAITSDDSWGAAQPTNSGKASVIADQSSRLLRRPAPSVRGRRPCLRAHAEGAVERAWGEGDADAASKQEAGRDRGRAGGRGG